MSRTVACQKSVNTSTRSREQGLLPPNIRMRAVRNDSSEPSPRQSNHDCANKRCKSPLAGMQKSHQWNVALTEMATTRASSEPSRSTDG